jgi:transcription elongation factor GreA
MDGSAMTEAEMHSLREELNDLESAGRAEIAARIRTAREWGDLKENGEYQAAKEAQAHLETRILRLRDQLRGAVIVEAGGVDQVQHGSTVEVTDLGTQAAQRFKIVSLHEADPNQGLLSASSPVAQALIGHERGDEVEIEIPAGIRRLRIDSIA